MEFVGHNVYKYTEHVLLIVNGLQAENHGDFLDFQEAVCVVNTANMGNAYVSVDKLIRTELFKQNHSAAVWEASGHSDCYSRMNFAMCSSYVSKNFY